MDNLRAANELARRQAFLPDVVRHAREIIGPNADVVEEGPFQILRWVRSNLTYWMEAPDGEIIRGYYSALKDGGGDCDCLSVVCVALLRSVGLHAFVVGVSPTRNRDHFSHAMVAVYQPGVEGGPLLLETVDDSRYGGQSWPYSHVPEFAASLHYYDARKRRWVRLRDVRVENPTFNQDL